MRSPLSTTVTFLVALFIWVTVGVPTAQNAHAATPSWVFHKVKRGDTLGRIAKRYKTTASAIRKLNGLTRRSAILPGQKLRVKARTAKLTKKERAKKRKIAAREKRKAKKQAKTKASKEKRSSKRADKRRGKKGKRSNDGWITHKVKRGDYLWGIADRYDVTTKAIVRLNRLGRRPKIRPGMVLRIKEGSRQVLVGGVALPRSGPGYKAIRPARSYGTPGTVRLIAEVYEEVADLHPGTVPGLVADLSKQGGGHLRPHRSHQRGVDVDVSYFKKGNKKTRGLEVMTAETFDLRKNWDLIRAFINTGNVSVIFMDHKLQGLLYRYLKKKGYDDETLSRVMQYPRKKSERRGILRHHPGHHHHLHVRFTCESANDPCKRPAVAIVPALGNERVVAAVRKDRPRADVPAVMAEPAPVEEPMREAGAAVAQPVDVPAKPAVAVAREEHQPRAPSTLRRDGATGQASASRGSAANGREAFAAIAGLRGPQPGVDAYSRLEFDRSSAPKPAAAAAERTPAGPRAPEAARRMTRFGCVGSTR